MLILKTGQDALVPVVLNDATTGNAYNGALYNNVLATIIKNDGTVVDLGELAPTDWTQIETGAYSLRGYYLLKIPASAIDQEGMLHYGVAVTGVEFYPGVATVRANTEKNIFDRIGAPVGASISADIQNISAAVGGEGGFQAADRQTLLDVKAKTDLLPTDPADQSLVEAAVAATFTASDRSNLGAIKAKTDNLPAVPASQGDVTTARDNVNTNTNSRATELKGTSWNGTNDTLHQLRLKADSIDAKTANLPADPASESGLGGAGYDPLTDSLHQLQLAISATVSGEGGFGPTDRATIQAIEALLPPAGVIASNLDVEAAMGVDTTNSPFNVKRTISEVYVYARNNIHAKTTNLPADPASNTVVNARATEMKGSGWAATDSLKDIKSSIVASNFTQADRDAINDTNADVNSMRTVVDNIRSETVAIKGKTDNLPVDPASNSHIDIAVGAGANAFTETERQALMDIKAKTDNLPPDPAAASAAFGSADRDVMSSIRAKTDLLPPDPASTTSITALSNKVGTPRATVSQDIADVTDVVLSNG